MQVLIFLSAGYLESKNCRREARAAVQQNKPIVLVRETERDKGGMSKEEVKQREKAVGKEVKASLEKAKLGVGAALEELYTDVYANEAGENEFPPVIRMPDVDKSVVFG